MSKTLSVIFDGEVLRPVEKTDLQPNARYRVIIEEEKAVGPDSADDSTYPLTTLLDLAADMGVEDFAAMHDRYAHQRLEDNGDHDE